MSNGYTVCKVCNQSKLDPKASRAARLSYAVGLVREGMSILEDLKSDYENWKDNLPENLQSSSVGEKLETSVDTLGSAVDEVENQMSEVESLDLPQGFGRD